MTDLRVIDLFELEEERETEDGRNPYGVEPKTADPGLSSVVMAANPPMPQACWRNAILAYWSATSAVAREASTLSGTELGTIASLFVTPLSDLERSINLYYVEGQMLMPLKSGGSFAIEHAWLETEDGRVIECTIREAGAGEEGWLYFTGLRLTLSEALEWLDANQSILPLSPLLARRKGAQAQAQAKAHHTAMLAAYWQAWGMRLDHLDGCALAFE